MKKHVILYEIRQQSWFARVPSLPGCVAQGTTRKETERRIKQAIRLYEGSRRLNN